MDPERLVEDLTELLEYGDRLAARKARCGYGAPRGGLLRKTPYHDALAKGADDGDGSDGADDGDEPNAHAKTKSDHHEKMAEAYGAISALHGKMADHYGRGAQGAHEHHDDNEPRRAPVQDGEADAAGEREVTLLKTRARDGDIEARLILAALEKQAVHSCLARPQRVDPSAAAFNRLRQRFG